MRPARLSVTAAVWALAMVAAGAGQAALAADSGSSARTGNRVVTVPVKIATLNTAHTISTQRAVTDVKKLAGTGADIITLQETASGERRRGIRAALVDCSGCPFDAYMPTPAVPGSTPILFRSDKFELRDSGTVQVSEPTFVGKAGAGPSTLNAKFINWVKLHELRTGRKLFVLNNHAVPSVQDGDGSANEDYPARLRLYRKHMEGLKTLIRSFQERRKPIFVTGDLNVNYRRDAIRRDPLFPYVNLGSVGVKASYQRLGQPALGTHGNGGRLIDYVSFTDHAAVEAVGQRVLTGYNSDHRPLSVDVTLTGVR